MASAPHVVIIGAGAVGAATALNALKAGLRVTLLDPGEPGGQQAASYGNAGWLTAHSVLPPAEPGAWKKIPKWLKDPLGPLAIRWGYLPHALPWLWRYLRAAWTWPQVERTAHALRSLLRDAPVLHAQQAHQAGVPELIEQRGVLHVFLSKAHFLAESRAWEIRRQEGVQWQELDTQALRGSQRLRRATPTAFGCQRPVLAAIRVPMLRHWFVTRSRWGPSYALRARPVFALNKGACRRYGSKAAKSPAIKR